MYALRLARRVTPRTALAVLVALALSIPFVMFGAGDAPAWVPPMVFRLSENATGTQVDAVAYDSAVSADGATVAFETDADNLSAVDNDGDSDVYVKEPYTGTVELISQSPTGSVGNDVSSNSFVSADGRFVVFASIADNLGPAHTNGQFDLFVRDRWNDTTSRVTLGHASDEPTAGTYYGQCTANGKLVAFQSSAVNLVPGVTESGHWSTFATWTRVPMSS